MFFPLLPIFVALAGPAAGVADPLQPPAAADERPTIEVPVVVAENRILVPTHVEGVGEALFILDTAASRTAIAPRLRERLTLQPSEISEREVQGSTGSTVMEFVRLPSLTISGEGHEGLWAVVADISDFGAHRGKPILGIIGSDLLARYDLDIDLPAGAIRLHRPGALAAGAPAGPVPIHAHGDLDFVQFTATLNDRPVQALLDTGARIGTLNWDAAALAGIGPDSAGVREEENGSKGIGGQRVPEFRYTFEGLCLPGRCLPPAERKIAELAVFEVLGIEGPAMLVGVETLKDCPIRISYSTDRLELCTSPPSS